MSLKLCTSEFLISDAKGFGFSRSWLPSMVAERFATSSRDGVVDRAPDQLAFIDTELVWTNPFADPVHLTVSLQRASRSFIASNPNTLVFDDAISWDIGASPSAPLPAVVRSGVGTRIKLQPFYFSTIYYGRIFSDYDDSTAYTELGRLEPTESVAVRYRCLFSTPGEWRLPVQPRHEAFARYARLRLWTTPYTDGVI
jgi:hypothetical protein